MLTTDNVNNVIETWLCDADRLEGVAADRCRRLARQLQAALDTGRCTLRTNTAPVVVEKEKKPRVRRPRASSSLS